MAHGAQEREAWRAPHVHVCTLLVDRQRQDVGPGHDPARAQRKAHTHHLTLTTHTCGGVPEDRGQGGRTARRVNADNALYCGHACAVLASACTLSALSLTAMTSVACLLWTSAGWLTQVGASDVDLASYTKELTEGKRTRVRELKVRAHIQHCIS